MKSDVEIYTMYLVSVIQDSREYKEFETVKRKLAQFPEMKIAIDQYRKDSYALQNFSDETQLYDKTEKFYEDSRELHENPLFEEYLSCELALCRMLQKIASTVVDAVDLELDGIAREIPFQGVKKSE